ISLETFGGDNGMPLRTRSRFGPVDLRNPYAFYYLVLALLALFLFLGSRFVNARFGMVIRAAKSNEPRVRAIGFSHYRYKLTAFVMSGGMCGLAGALLANQTEYLVPDFMHWTQSGELMFMAIRGLAKRFGGLRATDGVDLAVAEGETHAIIGPNGAGKTTLIGQLAGDLRPDAGTMRFGGRDVTALDAPARSRLGLARSFQITSIFPDFSALDNVALAVQAHSGSSFRDRKSVV